MANNRPPPYAPTGVGRGNHRRGTVRGTTSATRRGTLPAYKDPLILQRRQVATPLWIRGYQGPQILERVNSWLTEPGPDGIPRGDPVTLRTIYRDYEFILKGWQEDYEAVTKKARPAHLATLNRVKREAFLQYDAAMAEGRPGDALKALDRVQRAEEGMARMDGTATAGPLKAARESIEEEGGEEVLERVYLGVSLNDL